MVRVAVAGAELCGDVRDFAQVEDADDRVADGGQGAVRAADAAGVLAEDDVADIVVHFDGPVAAQAGEQVAGACFFRRQAGDAEDGDGAEQGPVRGVAVQDGLRGEVPAGWRVLFRAAFLRTTRAPFSARGSPVTTPCSWQGARG